MKSLLISSLILLLAVGAFAQEQSVSIRNIKGLDNKTSDFTVDQGASRQAHNIDFGKSVGALAKRLGYTGVDTLNAVDSIIDIYAAYYSDGTQQLFVIVDDPDSGWGRIYVTNKSSVNLSADSLTEIYKYWPTQAQANFTMYGDAVYISSPLAKGVVYSDGETYSFPMRSPGEPTIVPIPFTFNDSVWSGPKTGDYRYSFLCIAVDTSGSYLHNSTVIAGPIAVNGAVMITDFWYPSRVTTEMDSVTHIAIYVYRTRANPGRLDDLDTAFEVGAFVTFNDSLTSAVFIDSVNDDNLGSGAFAPFIILDNKTWRGVSSAGSVATNRYAAPGWIGSVDTATYTAAADSTQKFGIYRGMPKQSDTLGIAYVWTVQDTVSGFESDTSRACVVYDTGAMAFSMEIALPQPSPADSGLTRNLYRALIYQITYDTTALAQAARDRKTGGPVRGAFTRPLVDLLYGRLASEYLAVDTVIIADFYLVKKLKWDDTLYIDSVRYDSLSMKRRYSRTPAPPRLTNLITYDSRLVGSYGSNLYFSRLDSAYVWGGLDFISIGRDDGDVITDIYPTRNAIRVSKNNSIWNVYQDANLDWSLSEITQGFGIIAPRSYARGVGGNYYLTRYGVMRENEGQYLERTQALELVSQNIDNFDKLPISTLRGAVGFYHNQKYMLCIGDTTYVYDERANAWSTWGGVIFSCAVHYGTESSVEFVPGDSMYFIKSGDSVLYRYGATTDGGTQIIIYWKSVPMFMDANEWNVTSTSLWYQNASASDTVWAIFYGDGQLNSPDTSSFVSLDSRIRTSRKGRASNNPYTFFQLGLQQRVSSTSQLIIDGIDVYAQPIGREKIY